MGAVLRLSEADKSLLRQMIESGIPFNAISRQLKASGRLRVSGVTVGTYARQWACNREAPCKRCGQQPGRHVGCRWDYPGLICADCRRVLMADSRRRRNAENLRRCADYRRAKKASVTVSHQEEALEAEYEQQAAEYQARALQLRIKPSVRGLPRGTRLPIIDPHFSHEDLARRGLSQWLARAVAKGTAAAFIMQETRDGLIGELRA